MSTSALERYRAFVAAQPASEDGYLFDTPRCRFWPEPSDELVLAPGARAVALGAGAGIELGGTRLQLPGIELGRLQRALALLPCSLARLTLELGTLTPSFIEHTFSRVLFAPVALAELELEQPACEIVRFPGSPYEVVRSYWRNASAVRQRLQTLAAPPSDVAALRQLLLELHELLLLGTDDAGERRSFYLPQSALARKRTTPGELYEVESRIERRGTELLITSGARVSVPLLGGTMYWQLLTESVSDPAALEPERQLTIDGVELGRVVHGRAPEELQSRPWFLPPRPLSEAHFSGLLADLQLAFAKRRDPGRLLPALASFHFRFVRLHPLPSANQSLSMALVNELLRGALGIGMPHLLLDQLALRCDLPAYSRLFSRAARVWCTPWPSAAERVRNHLRMRAELNDFVSRLALAPSLVEARANLGGEKHAAELALLVEPSDGAHRIG
jgi:hypothetical protein